MDTKKMSKEERKELNKKVMRGPIENKALAAYIVDQVAKAFYIIAAVQVVFGILLTFLIEGYSIIAVIIGAAIFAGLAFWLQKTQSKIAAIILIILGALSVLGSIGSIAAGAAGLGGIVISVLTLWFAVRAFQATSFLAKKKDHTMDQTAG